MCHHSLPSVHLSKLPVKQETAHPILETPRQRQAVVTIISTQWALDRLLGNRPADTAQVQSLDSLLHGKATSCVKDS